MTTPLLNLEDGAVVPLPDRGEMPASFHVIDARSVQAINAALVTGRPLLVRGEPGTGKSQLARAAAEALKRAFVSHAVDSRTETRDLLWSVDTVARLAEAQVMGALRNVTDDEAKKRIAVQNFLSPGPLWWAFDWSTAREQAKRVGVSEPLTPPGWEVDHGVVVLVDEIDKADPAVPNGLLDALGHRRFDVPGHPAVKMDRDRLPLVVITTNEERALPDAFLRRCLVLHLSLPSDTEQLVKELIQRGCAHFETCSRDVLEAAARLLAEDREQIRQRDLAPPGLAEYIDLLHAVTGLDPDAEKQIDLLEQLRNFALRKHPPELLG